ncbi:MAG: phage tail sheath subtilisin-like domain-containing protein [Thermosynechococcaceae cyanobacterium]
MPITPTYPGVYVERISSGVRTITGVSTSVTAFIDYFKRGVMGKATQIFSPADFEREYGGLDALSEASYAIQQFYLNGGGEAWVVRTASGSFESAAIAIRSTTSGAAALTLKASSPGQWGDALRVRVDSTNDTKFDLTLSDVSDDGTTILRQEVFRNLTMSAGNDNVATLLNDTGSGSKLVTVPVAPTVTTIPLVNGTLSAAFTIPFTPIAAVAGRKVQVTINDIPSAVANLGDTNFSSLEEVRDRLQAGIRSARPDKRAFAEAVAEIYTVNPTTAKLRIIAGPGNPANKVVFAAATGDANTVTDLKLAGANVTTNVQAYTPTGAIANTGQAAGTPGDNGTVPNAAALQAAILALKDVSFNLLCIPRTAERDTEMTDPDAIAVISTALTYCEQRRAFFLLDPPKSLNTVQGIKDWLNANATLRTRNAAIYFPRVKIADPLNNFRLKSLAPSGTVAGVYARTDSERGVWKAPAGIDATLRGVQALDYLLNDPENGTLNPLAINALRTFPVYGTVCWGARTLRGADDLADEYKYIPVQRLALYLEESLFRGLKWVVFEPNDEPLWAQIRLNVGAFMNNLFRQGAFQGRTPREAYFVKCDKESTTQNDINLGIVNIIVGFAPLKPAEFVIIKLQQIAGQIAV